MEIIDGIPVFGDCDQETLNQMKEAMKYGAFKSALMADHHIGYSVPVGGVIAYERDICVNGVGYDIVGQNKADPASFCAALKLAATIARRRRR